LSGKSDQIDQIGRFGKHSCTGPIEGCYKFRRARRRCFIRIPGPSGNCSLAKALGSGSRVNHGNRDVSRSMRSL
jgi:hypothetical protein